MSGAPPISTAYRSPNCDSRRGSPVRLLVLHATVGGAKGSLSWLCDPKSKVSIHYLIDKAGTVYGLVDEALSAWHCGRSSWAGYTGDLNLLSIGIELENANDGKDPYPPAQIDALVALSRDIVARHQILPSNVVRHLDIAQPVGRKSDPAGFPWDAYRRALFAAPAPPPSAVVVTEPLGARVRAAPTTTATRLATLPHGTRVVATGTTQGELIDGLNLWRIVTLPDGRKGYIWERLVGEVAP